MNQKENTKIGPIYREFMIDKTGHVCNCLDVIKVKCIERTYDFIQPENYLVLENEKIEYIKSVSLKEVLELHPCEQVDNIFVNANCCLSDSRVSELNGSLVLVKVNNLNVYKHLNLQQKLKSKADFYYNGKFYSTFSITDPECYSKDSFRMNEAYLVISIGHRFKDCTNHYKFISKIYA